MFARTKRLTLRPGWPEDAPTLAKAIGHEPVVGKLGRVPWPYTLGDAEAFLAQPRSGHEPRFLIDAMTDGGPSLVGGIGISAGYDGAGYDGAGYDGEANFGYWLTPGAWGRGYATEAGEAVIAMARHALGLRRLTAFHFVDNPASGRVLAKLGFLPTGRIEPRTSQGRGGEAPAVVFALDLDNDQYAPIPLAA